VLWGWTSCEVQFSTSSQPDKNLYACVCVCVCQCLVMLQQWHIRYTGTAELLRDALRAIGRDDVITQCMTDYQQVLDDAHRQQAINDLLQRAYTYVYLSYKRTAFSTICCQFFCLVVCLKKIPTFKLSVTLSKLNRFFKFGHCWTAYEICYKIIRYYPPHLRHVSTLPWEIKNSNFLQIFSRYWRKCQQIAL